MSIRVSKTVSKNTVNFYAIEDYVNPDSGKRTTRRVEKLGSLASLMAEHSLSGEAEVLDYLKSYIHEKYEKPKTTSQITVTFNTDKRISCRQRSTLNVGYLFIMRILYCLKLDKICKEIREKNKLDFSLFSMLSLMIYAKLIFSDSKDLMTHDAAKLFGFKPDFKSDQVSIGLKILADESEVIEAKLHENSQGLGLHNEEAESLYSDFKPLFFEVEDGCELSQWMSIQQLHPTAAEEMIRADQLAGFIGFLTCRIIQKALGSKDSLNQILDTIRKMRITDVKNLGYVPAFERTDITDKLFEVFGFELDREFLERGYLKKIVTEQKRGRSL